VQPGIPRWLLLVAAMAAVGPVSIDMYLPGFPAIEREFGVRGVETTMASYLVGLAVSQLFYGPISDRFGRKPPLYFGFALYALGAAGCALATSMPGLTLMRVVQALGGSAGFVIGRAIVRDRCEPHEAARAFTLLMMIVALGPVLAPVAGGFVVTHFGWRGTFVFQAALGVMLLGATHFLLRDSRPESSVTLLNLGNVLRTYLRLGMDRALVGYALVGGFGMGALFSYVTGAPTVLTERYTLSPQEFGVLIGLNGFAFMAASRLNMIALRTIGPREVLARYVGVPVLIGAVLFAVTWFWSVPLWLVVALQLLFFVTVGRVTPNVAALALAPHGADAGAASALMGALQSALAMLNGFAVAAFNDGKVSTLAAIMTAGGALTLMSYLWAARAPQSQDGLRRNGLR
jgi:DHA1 family bicyclomycin/chloramphenicol resistance-like MFS transporter